MKGYIKNKYCIYLDQFAVSNLHNGAQAWIRIKELLKKGVENNLLVCPLSIEHFYETSGKLDSNAVNHHEYFESLSNNLCFRDEQAITVQLLISTVRNNNITANTFMTSSIHSEFSYKEYLNFIKKDYEKFTTSVVEFQQSMYPGKSSSNKLTTQELIQSISILVAKIVKEFTSRFEDLLRDKQIKTRFVEYSSGITPHSIDRMINILLKTKKMSLKEAKNIISLLKSHGFNKISTLDVLTHLRAYNHIKKKTVSSNDEIDFSRIATSIQISDFMFVDKARKRELKELKMDLKYNTQLFSDSNEDLIYFIKCLEEILI